MNNSQTNQDQWICPLHNFLALKDSSSKFYIHSASKSIIQSINTRILSYDYIKTYSLAEWRYQTQYPIIKVYHAHLERETREGIYINIFIEHIQQTLEQLENITLLQALYLIRTCLLGMERLVQKFGFFHLTNKMIGINSKNQCKLWVNRNFQQFKVEGKAQSQQKMIDRLFYIVESITEKNNENSIFFLQASQKCTTFIKSQNFINIYTYEQKLIIPPVFIHQPHTKQSYQFQNTNITQKNTSNYHSYIQSFSQNISTSNNQISKTERKINTFRQHNFNPQFQKSNKINIPISNLIMKESKHTMAYSSQNTQKNSKKCINSILEPFSTHSITLNHNKSLREFGGILTQQHRKMKIMSTLSLMIQAKDIEKKQIKGQQNVQYTHQMIKQLVNEGLQKNSWKKKISHLFSSDKNLKESLSYGEEQKSYLKDINLKKLGQFGRFIKTSLLQRDEEQESQLVSDFSTIIQ